MSKAAYWQRGEALDYVNTGTEKIEANTVIVLGSRIGVAGMEIFPGETGTLHVTGVYSMPKGSEEVTAGADVYYSETDGEITTTSDGNVKAGFACEGASASDSTILVKIKRMTLVAMRPVLYLAHQYSAGDKLPVNNPEMTAAWIEAGSAMWKEDDTDAVPAPKAKARPAAAEPGKEGRTDSGTELQGKVPKTPPRQKPKSAGKKT